MSFLDNTEPCGQLEYLNFGLDSELLVNKSFISETLRLKVRVIAVGQLGELDTIYNHPNNRGVVKE